MGKNLGMGSKHYKLDVSTVDSVVEDKKIGNYALGYDEDGSFYVSYVGRSDKDLRSRIKDYIGENTKYKEFKFKYTKTVKDAYEKECQNYHDFSGIKNEIHPDNPDKKQYKCPVCEQ